MTEHIKEKQGRRKTGVYEGFFYTKKENFDWNEYSFLSEPEESHLPQFVAMLTKPKGEKPTDEDISLAFAEELFQEMTSFDFDTKNAKKWFKALPKEFYTKQTYDAICTKMIDFELKSPEFEKDRLEQNLALFKIYAHQVNPDEIKEDLGTSSKLAQTSHEHV